MYRMFMATVIAAACAVPAMAQEEQVTTEAKPLAEAEHVVVSAETWEYVRQRMEYDTPAARVQRNAAFRSAQRRMRIEARNWYGVSLSRPTASPLPHMGIYSPSWAGSYAEPSLWIGYGRYGSYRVTDQGLR